MTSSVAQVVEYLSASGLLTAEEVRALESSLNPTQRNQEAGGFLQQLVRENRLTDYQAAQLRAGRADRLFLGSYHIQESIYQGELIEVLKAKDSNTGRMVALKILLPEAAKRKDSSYRFDREVQAAAKVSHPNIVAAYDSVIDGETQYLVMEYVDGPTLTQYVREFGPMPVDEALHCVYQAARGLEHAHSKRIIHRDVKPDNLLMDQEGTVKILDLGLVRFDHAPALGRRPESIQRLTQQGVMLGTVDFMSPEQCENPQNASYQSDIYSLGCTLYYLLFGESPFARETAMGTLMAHQNDPTPDMRQLRRDISPAVQMIFERMMAKTLKERYESMDELIQDLETVISRDLIYEDGEGPQGGSGSIAKLFVGGVVGALIGALGTFAVGVVVLDEIALLFWLLVAAGGLIGLLLGIAIAKFRS
ncbi:Serine/threonine protein kinase [Planctomycetales bacterium 10988]|nr:Serine/threonine protein kinase [Planctomycetales bacterium 10988]